MLASERRKATARRLSLRMIRISPGPGTPPGPLFIYWHWTPSSMPRIVQEKAICRTHNPAPASRFPTSTSQQISGSWRCLPQSAAPRRGSAAWPPIAGRAPPRNRHRPISAVRVFHDKAGVVVLLSHPWRWEAAPGHRPQSSSASRRTAGAFGFLTLIQCSVRPDRYGEPSRFDAMPSRPSAQACLRRPLHRPRNAG